MEEEKERKRQRKVILFVYINVICTIIDCHACYIHCEIGPSSEAEGIGLTTPEDKIRHLEALNKALEMQLAHKATATSAAERECRLLKEQVNSEVRKNAEQTQLTFDVTRDMTRQYKSMEDELLDRINVRESKILELMDDISKIEKNHQLVLERNRNKIENLKRDAILQEDRMKSLIKRFVEMLQHINAQFAQNVNLLYIMEQNEENKDANDRVPMSSKLERFGDITKSNPL